MAIATAGHNLSEIGNLLSRSRDGDAEAFCAMIRPLESRLLRQAYFLCGNLNEAEDLAQETLIEAWKSLARYNGNCRFSTWLYAILLHRHYKGVRAARSRPVPFSSLAAGEADQRQASFLGAAAPEASPAEAAAHAEQSELLLRCLNLLPQKHRQVIFLRFFAEASLPEMASALRCSVGTIKSRLHHALDKLSKMKVNLRQLSGDT